MAAAAVEAGDAAVAGGAAAVVAAAKDPSAQAAAAQTIAGIDVLNGLTSLVKRSATLDESIPLRAARACVPLLEGNSVGHEIVLSRRIEISVGRLGMRIDRHDGKADWALRSRAVLPVLQARKLVSPAFAKRFQESPIVVQRGRIELFTGILVRGSDSIRIRISSSANRRNRSFIVEESFVAPQCGELAPLVLSIVPETRSGTLVLEGELATLLPLPRSVSFRYVPLAEAVGVARAHVAFYDQDYFESKKLTKLRGLRSAAEQTDEGSTRQENKNGPTKKYRNLVRRGALFTPQSASRTPQLVRHAPAPASSSSIESQVVEAGPRQLHIERDRLLVRAALDMSFRFDGQNVIVELDQPALASLRASIEATWSPLFEGPLAADNPFKGALLYLTKYVTPHPRGEPNFFVKPPSLLATPPGWSAVVDGAVSRGFDVMRGAVRTDIFHALPMVFSIAASGENHHVKKGEVLAHVFVAPRAVLDMPVALEPFAFIGELCC